MPVLLQCLQWLQCLGESNEQSRLQGSLQAAETHSHKPGTESERPVSMGYKDIRPHWRKTILCLQKSYHPILVYVLPKQVQWISFHFIFMLLTITVQKFRALRKSRAVLLHMFVNVLILWESLCLCRWSLTRISVVIFYQGHLIHLISRLQKVELWVVLCNPLTQAV